MSKKWKFHSNLRFSSSNKSILMNAKHISKYIEAEAQWNDICWMRCFSVKENFLLQSLNTINKRKEYLDNAVSGILPTSHERPSVISGI